MSGASFIFHIQFVFSVCELHDGLTAAICHRCG